MSPELVEEIVDKEPEEKNETDFYQPRKIVLTSNIKNKEIEFTHQTVRLSDEIWLEFNRIHNPRRKFDGKKMVAADDLEKATRETYKVLVKEIPTGYQEFFRQTLTKENFADLIPFADQTTVVDRVFAWEISESETDEFFFDGNGSNEFQIDVPINGAVETGTVFLRQKTKQDDGLYKKAIEPDAGSRKRFRKFEISLNSDYDKLSELFASLNEGVGNFKNSEVPVWLQCAMMHYYFGEFAQSEAKN